MPPYQQPSSPSPPPQSVLDAKPPQAAAAAAPVPTLPPPPREVASGLSNLGNTCYINASMQALAHAPELCMALDIESHMKSCPLAKRNEARRRKRSHLRQLTSNSSDSGSCSSTSSKKKKKKPRREENSSLNFDPDLEGDEEDEFCTLCEVERLLGRVHSRPEVCPDLPLEVDASGPVVPETFATGFMARVAPWFRRGVQEDSHEFLRLLIDAMQNSCKAARSSQEGDAVKAESDQEEEQQDQDVEYPFRLFRGTVESNVICSTCKASSRKIDPIEDIGLDILPIVKKQNSSSSHRSRGSNSRSASPNNTNVPLAAVQEALERFTSKESLTGYKCEKCGKAGKATKTSQLASIPPILTLHLKRFRYGSISSEGNRRGGPRNVLESGPSGSAKIEGHVAFRPVLDIKPYLTEELRESTFKKAFCRLFAVVVHNGKNSHSGHYVAYVNSLNNKEWWKMDDAKVSRVTVQEVLNCEAYMLFYRVVDHPVSKILGEKHGQKVAEEKRVREEMERVIKEAEERAREEEEKVKAEANAIAAAAMAIKTPVSPKIVVEDDASPGKRKRPDLASGEEWAKTLTSLPSTYYPLLQQIQDFISENVTFRPEFFTYITQEYNRMSSKLGNKRIKKSLLGKGPSGVYPPDDVQDGAQDVRDGILDLFHMMSCVYKKANGNSMFLLPKPEDDSPTPSPPPVVEEAPAMTEELIIPEPSDSFDGYDGAL